MGRGSGDGGGLIAGAAWEVMVMVRKAVGCMIIWQRAFRSIWPEPSPSHESNNSFISAAGACHMGRVLTRTPYERVLTRTPYGKGAQEDAI